MPAIGVRDKLEVLHTVDVFVLGVELSYHPCVLRRERFETSRHDCNHKIVRRSYALPQQYRKLLVVVVQQQLHVMKHVLLAVEHVNRVGIVD